MSFSITRTQKKSSGSGSSTTIGYLNPIWYSFTIWTDTFTSTTYLGSDTLSVVATISPAVGDKIRIASDDGKLDGVAVGTVTVAGTTFQLKFTVVLPATTGPGKLVNLTNYRGQYLETQLMDWTGTTAIGKALSSWFPSPNLTGIIDIQSEVLSLAYRREFVSYVLPFYTSQSAFKFRFRVREVYFNAAGTRINSGFTNVAEDILAIPARKQIKEAYGNNLLEYVLKGGGKWLTRFNTPVVWVNDLGQIPRPLSFVVDPSYVPSITVIELWLDVNRNAISQINKNLVLPSAGLYSYIIKDAPPNAKHLKIQIYTNAYPPVSICYPIELRVERCHGASTLLEWENSLGGLDQWSFKGKQSETHNAQGQKEFETYDYDIENSNGNIGKPFGDSFTEMDLVDERVPSSDVPWLHELKASGQVRCIFENGSAVFVVPTNTQSPTRRKTNFSEFRAAIKFPRNFVPLLADEFTTEYQNILDYAIYRGYTLPSEQVQKEQNALLRMMKETGVWDDLDIFYNLTTDSDASFAFINWKNPGLFQAAVTAEPILLPMIGYQFVGVGYVGLNWRPGTHGVKYTLLNSSYGVYVAANHPNTGYDMGCSDNVDGVANSIVFNSRGGSGLTASRINDSASLNVFSDDAVAFWHLQRTGLPGTKQFKNGVQVASNGAAAVSLSVNNLIVGASNGNGSIISPSSRIVGAVWAGGNLVGKEQAFHSSWYTYVNKYRHLAAYHAIIRHATAQGYTLPTAGIQEVGKQYIRDLMDAGLWEELDIFYNMHTDGGLGFALINWKMPGFYQGVMNGSAARIAYSGIAFDGLSHVDTGWKPNATGTGSKYTQNDASFGCTLVTPNIQSNACDMGFSNNADGITDGSVLQSRSLTGAGYLNARINSVSNMSQQSNDSNGLYFIQRVSSAQQIMYRETIFYNGNNGASVPPPTVNLFLGATNGNGLPVAKSSRRMAMAWAGGSMVGRDKVFYDLWHKYRTAAQP